MKQTQKHEFAIYWQSLSEEKTNIIFLEEKELMHRIVSVLRLQPGDYLMLFNQVIHCRVVVHAVEKKRVQLHIVSQKNNIPLQPLITVLLPLLKKESLEQAIYGITAAGANAIRLVETAKVHRASIGEKEYSRFQKIMIAAAEQAKQYCVPSLHRPVPLEDAISSLASQTWRLYADPDGKSAFLVYQHLASEKDKELVLLVGPEGDLTDHEKEYVKNAQFLFTALTPTILKAEQAVQLSVGLWRSLL
jgi:16S rRNA (uracil1498-N3)-methyltransferase